MVRGGQHVVIGWAEGQNGLRKHAQQAVHVDRGAILGRALQVPAVSRISTHELPKVQSPQQELPEGEHVCSNKEQGLPRGECACALQGLRLSERSCAQHGLPEGER
eukprot:1159500-Pelagomonas_calceolata.AAC.22